MMNFKQFSFDPRIQMGIAGIGFTKLTPIQNQAIPVILKENDVLGVAQNGTGITVAFMLPILERLTRGPLRQVRALVLAPTRELVEQIQPQSTNQQ
jgi:ATP-dependent RNA helicase RhlE